MSDAAAPGARLMALWRRLRSVPGGKRLFSRMLGRMVPYTGSVRAHITELEPGRATAELIDRKSIRNHLGSVHAVALANLGELVTGLSVLSALPAGMRGIVTRLSAEYLRKARGRLTASADVRALDLANAADASEIEAVAEIVDESGQIVARVTAHWRVNR